LVQVALKLLMEVTLYLVQLLQQVVELVAQEQTEQVWLVVLVVVPKEVVQ
jgi:hypothetical protein